MWSMQPANDHICLEIQVGSFALGQIPPELTLVSPGTTSSVLGWPKSLFSFFP